MNSIFDATYPFIRIHDSYEFPIRSKLKNSKCKDIDSNLARILEIMIGEEGGVRERSVGEKSRNWMEGERTWSDECSLSLLIQMIQTQRYARLVRQLDFNKRCVSTATLVPSK